MSQETIRDGPVCDAGQVRDTRWTDTRLAQFTVRGGQVHTIATERAREGQGDNAQLVRSGHSTGQESTLDGPGVDTRRPG